VAGRLLGNIHEGFDSMLSQIEYAPVAIVSLGYRKPDVDRSLDGFGFLVPRSAGLRVLGTVWNSSLFPNRAPEGHALLTSFVGGATDPHAASFCQDELVALVHSEISPLLTIRQPPLFSNVQICKKALPQYNIGHGDRMDALEKLRLETPNLWLVGNYLYGPSIGACVGQALDVAEQISQRQSGAKDAPEGQ
jgi:oxygen-dependent protoporphyrinogen oxidase